YVCCCCLGRHCATPFKPLRNFPAPEHSPAAPSGSSDPGQKKAHSPALTEEKTVMSRVTGEGWRRFAVPAERLRRAAAEVPALHGAPIPRRDSLKVGIALDGSPYGLAVARFGAKHRDL